MNPPFDIPADLDTPVSAFLKLAPLQPRFLLESVEGGERQGRYSFIVFGPGLEVELRDGILRVGEDVMAVPDSTEGVLDALRAALARAPHPGDGLELPFTGGLVGITGYDLVRRIERLPVLATPGDGHPEARYFAPRSLLVFDHVSRRVAFLHDGPDAERQKIRRRVIAALRGGCPGFPAGGTFSEPAPSLSRDAFCAGVEAVREHIRAGDVFQLVLSSAFRGTTDLEPFEVYRALRLLNPSPYLFFFQADDLAVIGSSPEALVKLRAGNATLRPIAGTRPRGRDEAEDLAHERELLADPKEAAEHVMLVDLARNDLGRVAQPGTIRVAPSRVIERYSHVMHIVSGVQGRLAAGRDQFDLFAATFPAGTVVGAPKVRAMELIEGLEPQRRGLYAGTVGYFGHGDTMDQAIAIRTLTMMDGTYTYQAGAGVVADSTPDGEHREILAKSGALRAALALAAEGL